MTGTLGLEVHADRCGQGFHLTAHHPSLCSCMGDDIWSVFTDALRRAARESREIHQADMRPLIRGRIAPKSIGRCYSRARREGLIREIRREQSNDEQGRNTNKWEPVYELRSAA